MKHLDIGRVKEAVEGSDWRNYCKRHNSSRRNKSRDWRIYFKIKKGSTIPFWVASLFYFYWVFFSAFAILCDVCLCVASREKKSLCCHLLGYLSIKLPRINGQRHTNHEVDLLSCLVSIMVGFEINIYILSDWDFFSSYHCSSKLLFARYHLQGRSQSEY